MAKTPSTDTASNALSTGDMPYDPDAGLTQSSGAPISREVARADDVPKELTLVERIERIENLAALYFGAHHFEAPAPVFNPDAERDSARARFQQEMERIETATRKTN